MKQISEFRLTCRGALILDLVDAKNAVVVDADDGSVTFHEGTGLDRMSGVYISGSKVLAFQVDTSKGDTILRLFFQGKEGNQSYVLGAVEDQASAESWASRVNSIYTDRKAFTERIAEWRQGEFRRYPVVHDIFEFREAKVLPGDYIYSGTGESNKLYPQYIEPWERYLISRTYVYLRQHTGLQDEIKEDIAYRMPHHYNWLSTRVKYNKKNFDKRITHPLEWIFDHEERHDKISVNPLGLATHLAVLYSTDNKRATEICPISDRDVHVRSFEKLLQRIGATTGENKRAIVCAPQDHLVDFLLNDAMRNNVIADTQKVAYGNISNMGDWLWSNITQGVIACDVGEAFQIMRLMKAKYGGGADSLQFGWIEYEEPVSVGLCCRCDDPKWQEICNVSIKDVRESKNSEVQESLAKAKNLAHLIGIELFKAA